MRLLANENVPGDLVNAQRQASHDVVWVREDSPGAQDVRVLARAQLESRVLLTFDKDFGELAFRAGLDARSGVILVRLVPKSPAEARDVVVSALAGAASDPAGQFVVVERDRVRVTPLPKKA